MTEKNEVICLLCRDDYGADGFCGQCGRKKDGSYDTETFLNYQKFKRHLINELAVKPDSNLTEVKPEVKQELKEQRFNNNFEIANMLSTAGTMELTEVQEAILFAPVNTADVEIRPDGLIYLPWMEYVTRLRKAFGCKWAIIPNGMPEINGDNLVVWGFYLVVNGKLMGYAMGEQEYKPSNPQMTYVSACEAAKSNALMRLCKGIGITLELWKPSFIRDFKDKNCYSYTIPGKVDKYGKLKLFWKLGKKPVYNKPDESKEQESRPNNPVEPIEPIDEMSEQDKQNAIESGLADAEPETEPTKAEVKKPKLAICEYPTGKDSICGVKIYSQKTIDYSIKNYNKIYCYDCQQKAKQKGAK
jgi:hypothetical protein